MPEDSIIARGTPWHDIECVGYRSGNVERYKINDGGWGSGEGWGRGGYSSYITIKRKRS